MASESLFEIVGKDPQLWLQHARMLKTAAGAMLEEFRSVLRAEDYLGTMEQKMAFMDAYMLLMGMAFENLIKGILVARDNTVVSKRQIGKLLGRGGHGLAEGVRRASKVSSDELDLLTRLEEFLVWAGRYPIPIREDIYADAEVKRLRTFRGSDPGCADQLFERLSSILQADWRELERRRRKADLAR